MGLNVKVQGTNGKQKTLKTVTYLTPRSSPAKSSVRVSLLV